ncbi:MAG: CPBP family intramembrane glutamic endopeptidase [Bacteroidota bacterium]
MFFQNVYKGRNEFWAYLLTILVVGLAYTLGGIPFMTKAFFAAREQGLDRIETMEAIQQMDFTRLGMDPNIAMLFLLLVFVITFVALWWMVRLLHQRSFKSLITTNNRLNWSKMGFGFLLWMCFSLVVEGTGYLLEPENYSFSFNASSFIPLLVIAFLLLPIQTSAEELFFRGYLMQALGQVSGERLFPLFTTSILFGLMHMANPEVSKFGTAIMMTYYIGMGLFLGLLTVMDESLELALGIHAANNIFGVAFVNFDGSALQTDALFHTSEVHMELMLSFFVVFTTIITFICAKKYGWKDWGKLRRPIERQALEQATTPVDTNE